MKYKCKKCGICAKNCPVSCITGEIRKTPFVISQNECIKCGNCYEVCPFDAIDKLPGQVSTEKVETKEEINVEDEYYKV